jgi:hypothetical protein
MGKALKDNQESCCAIAILFYGRFPKANKNLASYVSAFSTLSAQ